MQTPTPTPVPTPSPAYLAACHAGAAARALEASYRAQIAELERHGRDVLRRFSPAQLAAALYASAYVSQLDGRLGSLDLDALEDLAALILRLEHADEQGRAA